jgi:hypothetical protein
MVSVLPLHVDVTCVVSRIGVSEGLSGVRKRNVNAKMKPTEAETKFSVVI